MRRVRLHAARYVCAAPYAYDAVYAIARAIHQLVEVEGKSTILGAELRSTLIDFVSFEGVTGTVDFHDGSAHPDLLYNGDRRVGVQYRLLNYQSFVTGLVEVGRWSSQAGNSSWASRFTATTAAGGSAVELIYSTADNSKPIVPVPPHTRNLVPSALFTMSMMLSGVGIALAVFFFCWTLKYRSHEVLKGAQPDFLLVVAVGCAVSLATTFPMARDHADRPPALNVVADQRSGKGVYPELDTACNMQLWFYCGGFAITYGALFVKLCTPPCLAPSPPDGTPPPHPHPHPRGALLTPGAPY